MELTIGIADDHNLFLKSLSILIDNFNNCKVIVEATNGGDLLTKMELVNNRPDILLLDVSMPGMNGVEVAKIISEKYPEIKMSALSSKDDDTTIINMIRAGCCAYLLKDMHPVELEIALLEIDEKGFYNGDASNINYRRLIKKALDEEIQITAKEKTFLQLACSDLTYKQLATKMNMAERTIDGYRESLFQKFNVQSRVGMVLEGIRRGIVLI